MEIEHDRIRIVGLARGGREDEVEEVVKMLWKNGFGTSGLAVEGLSRPEVNYNGGVYRGIREITEWLQSLKGPEET